ncbi:MAG TPA: flagellar motor protein MotB, partial [Rhodocyclaceae bacterium]|nr:flagellar motor protein MotB [Rhodocyclaceae bacterium]
MSDDTQQPIVVKKIKKGGGGAHGGAWKIAYADFVTAMMAFFLLMWLINTTSPEQKRGVADYFAPANVSQST